MGQYAYDGPSLSTRKDPPPYDHHCPEMGSGLNYYKSACLKRQKDESQNLCFGGCRAGERKRSANNGWTTDKMLRRKQEIIRLLKAKVPYSCIAELTGAPEGSISRIKKSALKRGEL